jgi:hypothetical protein
VDAEIVERFGDSQLVLDGRRDPLHLEAVAKCRVEDLNPVVHVCSFGSSLSVGSRATKKPPVGGRTSTWGRHVLYVMIAMVLTR